MKHIFFIFSIVKKHGVCGLQSHKTISKKLHTLALRRLTSALCEAFFFLLVHFEEQGVA